MVADAFDYTSIAEKVEKVVRAAFPNASIETEKAYQGRVRLKIVSKDFNGMTEEEKQRIIWDVLRSELGTDSPYVSLALVYGMDEI